MIRKMGPYVFLVAALMAAYISFDWAVGAAIHSRKVVLVPDLTAKAVNDALNSLGPIGLGLEKEGEQFEKEMVMATDPPAGAIIAKNGLVNLVLSDGPPAADLLLVPEFVGRSFMMAKEWTTGHQMQISTRNEADTGKPEGEILSQSPVA